MYINYLLKFNKNLLKYLYFLYFLKIFNLKFLLKFKKLKNNFYLKKYKKLISKIKTILNFKKL